MGKQHAPGHAGVTALGNHLQSHSSSPIRTIRVGGGYRSEQDHSAALQALHASQVTLKALPAPEGPYSQYDLNIIQEILHLAHDTVQQDYEAGKGSGVVNLVRVLQAYEAVLPLHGVAASEDVHYYRALLKLSLDPDADWWSKFAQLCLENQSHWASAADKLCRPATSSAPGGLSAAPPAAGVIVANGIATSPETTALERKQHKSIKNSVQPPQAAGWNVSSPCRSPARVRHSGKRAAFASNGSTSAVEAAAAAVEAASTAVAAALSQAAGNSSDYTFSLAGEPRCLPQGDLLACQQGWTVSAAEWPDDLCHVVPSRSRYRGTSDAAAGGWHSSCSDLIAAVEAAEGVEQQWHRRSLGKRSKCMSPSQTMARSLSPISRCRNTVPAATVAREANSWQRPRSASPTCQHSPAASSTGSPAYMTPSKALSQGWCTSAAETRTAAVSNPAPAAGIGSMPTFGDAALRASCITPQRPARRSDESRPSSPWHAEAATCYLSDIALDQYVRFSRRMSEQHDWPERVLNARRARDLQAAAEHRWRLAMSFWEVHCVWRCFQRWRSWAALSAEDSSATYRRWLLLCSFKWWIAMVRHYRRDCHQQQSAAEAVSAGNPASAAAAETDASRRCQADMNRPCSPLTDLSKLLRQQPHLRPPTSAAGALRQQFEGKTLAGAVFIAWLQLVKQRQEVARIQSQLAWHHIQHVQAGVWNKWRVRFEQHTPQNKLMRVVYRARRHGTLRRVVHHWRIWAPRRRAKRRRLRDVQMQMSCNKQGRMWHAMRSYALKRRASKMNKAVAFQCFRTTCLCKHLRQWVHILDIKDAFEQLFDTYAEGVMQRKKDSMFRWWQRWILLQQEKYEQQERTETYMAAYKLVRCLSGWLGVVVRRQQLLELEQMGRSISAASAGRAAMKAWYQAVALRQRLHDVMEMVVAKVVRRQISAAWRSWTVYMLRRRQQHQALHELSQLNVHRMWQQAFTSWRKALHEKLQLRQATAVLITNMVRRCVQHWKAWVDQKVDWREFQSVAVQQLLRTRLSRVLIHWHQVAEHKAVLRQLLGNCLDTRRSKQLKQTVQAWQNHLAERVAKRMNQLSALLHWEQSLLKKAVAVWKLRTAVWRWKRMRLLRGASYHALRLMDLALTSWTSVWVEAQELKQKAAFYIVGHQAQLKVQMLRVWKEEAAWIRLKRQRMEIAALHNAVNTQQQVLTAWRSEAVRRIHLRAILIGSIQRWSQLQLARAFQQWRSWALEEAVLHRKAKAVMSLMAGRTLDWAFCVMREHALRKRRTHSARHYRQQRLIRSVLTAWHQQASDALAFRQVLVAVGSQMRQGLLSETLGAWRDVVQTKTWKEAIMMRALIMWGGNRKKLCFQTWRQWTAIKQHRRDSVFKAQSHWQHQYLLQGFGWWREYTLHRKVASAVLEHFRLRSLRVAFSTWRTWQQRRAYLAGVSDELKGRGHQQILQLVLDAWRAFVPSRQVRRQSVSRAHTYWLRRLQAVCFFSWQDFVTHQASKRERSTAALLHWRGKTLARTFRAWKQTAEINVYRQHVISVVSGKLSNALLLRAVNAWRDYVETKLTQREKSAAAAMHWARIQLIKSMTLWRESTRESIISRRVLSHWQQRLLAKAFLSWHDAVQTKQRHGVLMRVVSSKQQSRLLSCAWAAWRGVIDQRHQVASRLSGVARQLMTADMTRVLDSWREVVLLHQLARMAAAKHITAVKARCLASWRQWALRQRLLYLAVTKRAADTVSRCFHGWIAVADKLRTTSEKVHSFRAHCIQSLATNILHEWAELAYELPRERLAVQLHSTWLQQRSLWAWMRWLQLKVRWEQLESDVAAHWCNLHLAAAWGAWRDWMQQRQMKQQQMNTVSRRWNNLHLAAAFQAWHQSVRVTRHHQAAQQLIAGRWQNLHIAAAFGAWKIWVTKQKSSRSVSTAVAQRWNNLHLAAAFGAWRDATQAALDRVAAAEAVAQQKLVDSLAVAFLNWKDHTLQKSQLRAAAVRVEHKRRRALLVLVLKGWQAGVQWQHKKQLAVDHWRQRLLHSLLQCWKDHTVTKQRHQRVLVSVASRSEVQLLRRSFNCWQQYNGYRQQKAAAAKFAAAKMQCRIMQAWQELTSAAGVRMSAAHQLAARVSSRSSMQATQDVFAAWVESSARSKALKALGNCIQVAWLRAYMHAWQAYSRQLVGASLLLRRQLAGTLQGAFHEWRAVAAQQAYWHRVEDRLVQRLQETTTLYNKANKAALYWLHWPMSVAFSTWRAVAADQIQDQHNVYRAVKFLYYALTLKALTAFKYAVHESKVHAAADEHRQDAMRRAVLRGWAVAAGQVKEKRHKLMAALHSYSTRLTCKAFNVWVVYSQYKQHKAEHLRRARHHDTDARRAVVFRAWLQLTRYLVPLRTNLLQLERKRHRARLQQILAAWLQQTRRSQVLQQAVARLMHKTLAQSFTGWKQAVKDKLCLQAKLHSAMKRLNWLSLSHAFGHWHHTTQQLKLFRTKAQKVLRHMVERCMRGAVTAWKAAVAHQIQKRALLDKAIRSWRQLYIKKAMVCWAAILQEARHFQLLSDHMLLSRRQQQRQSVLLWWHLVAQDLHHHRVVLDYFRARRIRRDGTSVFWYWKDWAQDRRLERKAVVAYWNRLLVTAFAGWLEHHEDVLWQKAAAHDAARRTALSMFAWKVAMALIHRKRVLTAAAKELHLYWCVRKAISSWLRYTYYRHMGHVALHFRIRRLCCVVLQEWCQAAQTRAQERLACLELTHLYATRSAKDILLDWQHQLTARRHYHNQLIQGCFSFWVYWAPVHSTKNAKWRQVAEQLQGKIKERCFYTWRWYCQVRVLRSVAFHNKQRALREAVAIGEQVARRKKRELLTATFMAWHVQVRKYRRVAEKLAGLLQHNLTTCFHAWRAAADQARVDWLQAERHSTNRLLAKVLPAFADVTAQLKADREAAEATADRFYRRTTCRKAIHGWVEELQMYREQRQALWKVMVMLLQLERKGLLAAALHGWHQIAQQQVTLRCCIASFVDKRRLNCLSEYFTIWHQYAAAMRTNGVVLPVAASAAARGWSPSRRTAYHGADLSGAFERHSISGLPVSGGPGSPVLGFRSAHQDRRLARRIAAMGGGAPEVDPGSDDEDQLFADLPSTAAAVASAERHERQQPLLALSKGFRQRRVTLNDDKAQYDDAATAAGLSNGGYLSPRFDLHSVADSMILAHEQGLSPWQLPSVRSPKAANIIQDTLTLEQLHHYQQQYPYSLIQHQPQQLQQQHGGSAQQQASPGPAVIGRPGSAGGYRKDYQPLLQRQLETHEQRLEMQQWQLGQQQQDMRQWQQRQAGPQMPGSPVSSPQHCQQQQCYEQRQPWHESPGKNQKRPGYSAVVSDTHWQERRGNIIGDYTATENSQASIAGSSSASAQLGSDVDAETEQQQHVVLQQREHEKLYGKWAVKAWRGHDAVQQEDSNTLLSSAQLHCSATVSNADHTPSGFRVDLLPKNLSGLITPVRGSRGISSSTDTARWSNTASAVIGTPSAAMKSSRLSSTGVHAAQAGRNSMLRGSDPTGLYHAAYHHGLQHQQASNGVQRSLYAGHIQSADGDEQRAGASFSVGSWQYVGN